MAELENNVLTIEKDGLVWGEAKLEAIAFGIKKLRINRGFSFISTLEIPDSNSSE
jgi:translation elongation factor EF-1beta